MRCFFAQNRFSWPNGQLLPIHTIQILKAIVPAVDLAYLGTLYVHPMTRPNFRNIVGINYQYQLKPCHILISVFLVSLQLVQYLHLKYIVKENGSTFYARFPLGAACCLMFTPYLVNVKLVQGGLRHIVQLEDILPLPLYAQPGQQARQGNVEQQSEKYF